VGLDYLTLDSTCDDFIWEKIQRIRLATQIGLGLTGVLYVLDEPSIGLHQRDNSKLLETLQRLRDLGNTLIVSSNTMKKRFGQPIMWSIFVPKRAFMAEIICQGSFKTLLKSKKSITGSYLSGRKVIETPQKEGMVMVML